MTIPNTELRAFQCPHCSVEAQQNWVSFYARPFDPNNASRTLVRSLAQSHVGRSSRPADGQFAISRASDSTSQSINGLSMSTCDVCDLSAVWAHNTMIYPRRSLAPRPSPDMPPEVLADYNEAGQVLFVSPRASAALLRLATEKLLGHILKKEGVSINDMIADFVALGVSAHIQQAMDILRITGNEAVHPGQLDTVDDPAIAGSLFSLINLIVETQISQPAHIAKMYQDLPEAKLAGVEARDKGRAKLVSRET